jgi:hypothetical protein
VLIFVSSISKGTLGWTTRLDPSTTGGLIIRCSFSVPSIVRYLDSSTKIVYKGVINSFRRQSYEVLEEIKR